MTLNPKLAFGVAGKAYVSLCLPGFTYLTFLERQKAETVGALQRLCTSLPPLLSLVLLHYVAYVGLHSTMCSWQPLQQAFR